jgi:hypothetical protein
MPSMPSNHIHTMMDYPLTLTALLERAGRYAANVEIVSRLPNRSMHRTTWDNCTSERCGWPSACNR